MKKTVSRLGSAALCVTLSLALGCGCAVMPPASSEKPASSAVSVPTDAEGKPLYDATRLDDGRLRILYGYDNSGDCRTVLCGSKVLYQSARSETVSLLQDIVTGETNYWFRTWSDSTGRGGRRSALYDKDGNEVMAFDGEQSATIQNGLLVLQESRMVGDSYDVDYDSYGTCSVIDLATGKNLPVPEGAYSCIVCGDMLVFTCYARHTLPQTNGTTTPACTAGSPSSKRTVPRPMGPPPPRPAAFPMSRMNWTTGWNWTSPMQTAARPTRSCTTLPPGRTCAATGRPAATVRQLS